MKTFSTSGTGSEQTLSEIESEKIPVYESEADLDADLANLADGQIVATKDTGSELSAPVDTVQSGNLHAVTSNAVAGALLPNMEMILNGNMLTSQEYQIASENYDCLYFDVEPVSGAYHYTLLIPCALLTTTYALYWLTGFYQNTASNFYIAMGVKKDSVKATFIQRDGNLLSQLDNVKLYGLRFNNR